MNEPHKFVLNFSQRLDLRSSNKHVFLQNLSIYYMWKNIRKQYKRNELKITDPIWNDEFELPDGSYSVSNVQDYMAYIIQKHEKLTTISPIHVYINRINKLVLKIRNGHKLEVQMPETMKLFGSTTKINKQNKKWSLEVVEIPSPEVVEVALVQCNLKDYQYQQKSEVIYTFTPYKSYAYLLSVEPSNIVF